MRLYNSAFRYAYNRFLDNYSKNEVYHLVRQVFKDLPSWYVNSAIEGAVEKLKSIKSQGINPRKVVFGGKKNFEKLCKHHLVEREWHERRKGRLVSIGNPNMKFVLENDGIYLQITSTRKRKPIKVRVKRKVKSEKDKWITFISMLLEGKKFPYTVELKKINGKIYGFVSFQIPTPEVKITRENGVIGIDINAKPFHLAIAEINKDGNLISYKRIKLGYLNNFSKNRKEYEEWLIAHKIINLAKEKNKAIVIENIENLPKGKRGDGKKKLRKVLGRFSYERILNKIERLCKLNGIEIIKVNPAWTSVQGKLKYSPQLNIDKDIAGAYVIGRRGLRLLKDKRFLNYLELSLKQRQKELEKKLKKETNKYKQNPIKIEINKIKRDLKLIKSLQSEPEGLLGAYGRNLSNQKNLWQALEVALTTLLPEKRCFSPLKPILVEGKWERVVGRLGPFCLGGPK
ncbi:MAG: IS200/IS605 family accessory protein TnpB-related protein [Candidatus Hydrothermia bacterium]|jgi:IS605 OrfB family transposase|nr:IS200/IS605 family accessory protein TnpB-related protein [Candidatus Hydrothermia bacterium]